MKKDKLGGFVYERKEALKKAEHADLVTLPKALQNGINCSNCTFVKVIDKEEGVGSCQHPEVLLPVTKAQCCSYQNSKGMLRSWERK